MGEVDLTALAASSVAGLVSGAAGALWLEGWWRPRRDRRRAARILLREINVNQHFLRHHLPHIAASAYSTSAPADLVISRVGLETVGPLLSELPPPVVGQVLEVYARFTHIEWVIAKREQTISQQAGPISDPKTMRLQRSVVEATETLKAAMEDAVAYARTTMEALGEHADDNQWDQRAALSTFALLRRARGKR